MAARKVKEAGAKAPAVPALSINADEIRNRIRTLTSAGSVPDPLAIRPMSVISSGFLALDAALGTGGFIKGGLHAIEGEPDGGKTVLLASIIGAWQRIEPESVHAYLDVEGKTKQQMPFLKLVGLNTNPKRLLMFYPESAEEAAEIAMLLLGYGINKAKHRWERDPSILPVTSISWDSWAGSPVDTVGMAALARVGAQEWPRLAVKAARVGTTIFCINQLRTKPGVSFGDPRYSPGGDGFKFSQTSRIWVTRSGVKKDEATKRKIGHDLRLDIQRNKGAAPASALYLSLNYSTGFDLLADALTCFEMHGVTMKEKANGNIYVFAFKEKDNDEEAYLIKEKGREAFLDALGDYPDAAEKFIEEARHLSAKNLGQESDDTESPSEGQAV